MPVYRAAVLVVVALLAGCKGAPPSVATSSSTPTLDDTSSAMIPTPETHLFDLADSTQVWLVTGRAAHGNGGQCIERGIQLRKGPFKIPVPLLYTSTLPEVVNGQLVAEISKDCVTGDAYAIDPKTGQPTKLGPAAR